MSGWQRCDTCRKVRTGAEFDAGATTCRDCLTGPAPTVRKKSAPVVTTRSRPRTEAAPTRAPAGAPAGASAERRPLLGSVGSGDLEVRERRARRAAHEALEQSHPDEFRLLLRDARQAEGLRPTDTSPAPAAAPVSDASPAAPPTPAVDA